MILLSFKAISGHFPGPCQAGVGNMTTIPEELCSKSPVVCMCVCVCIHVHMKSFLPSDSNLAGQEESQFDYIIKML